MTGFCKGASGLEYLSALFRNCHRMLELKEYPLDGDKKREDMREGEKDYPLSLV